MELKFSDEDCCTFVISTKGGNNSMSNAKTMTEPIKMSEKSIETRAPNKDMEIQCDGLEINKEKPEHNEVDLMAFLRSKMGVLEEVFREQNNIENTTGKFEFNF